jgi:ATP/maltotriose-dependent transcriptional regulator MalT
MLEQVERAGLFLVPLDEVRGWWRYHHLFADLLRARLQQQQPRRVTELLRAAAAWSKAHGLADDAIRHALGAGDPDWAARLIEQHFDGIFLQGESATVQRWLSGLPADHGHVLVELDPLQFAGARVLDRPVQVPGPGGGHQRAGQQDCTRRLRSGGRRIIRNRRDRPRTPG